MEINTNHHPVPRTSSNRSNTSSSSKQKIMKLKEELHSPAVSENHQFVRIKQLKDSYDLAILRMNEMNNAANTNMYVKIHGQKASKMYSALSSLIYASIAVAKVEGLEDFVRQSATTLPTTMVDLEEWEHILHMARECREQTVLKSLQQPVSSLVASHQYPSNSNHPSSVAIHPTHPRFAQEMKQKLQLLTFLAINPIRNTRDEVGLLRQGIIEELNSYQNDLTQAMNLIFYITQQLRDMQNADLNAQKIMQLKAQMQELFREMESKSKAADELLQQTIKNYETNISNMQDQHNQEVQSWESKYQDLLTTSNHKIADQEQNIAKLKHTLLETEKLLEITQNANQDLQSNVAKRESEVRNLNQGKQQQTRDYQNTLIATHAHYCSEFVTDFAMRKIVHHDEIRRQQSKIHDLSDTCQTLENKIRDLKETVAKKKKDIASLEDDNSKRKVREDELSRSLSDVKSLSEELAAAKISLESEKQRLESLIEEKLQLLHDHEAKHQDSQSTTSQLQAQLAQLQAQLAELQQSTSHLEKEKIELEQNRTKLEATIAQLKTQEETSAKEHSEAMSQLLDKVKICQEEINQKDGMIRLLESAAHSSSTNGNHSSGDSHAAGSSSIEDALLLHKCEQQIQQLVRQLEEEQAMSNKLMALLNESEVHLKQNQLDLKVLSAQHADAAKSASSSSSADPAPQAVVTTTVVINMAEEEKQVFDTKVQDLSKQIDDKNQEIDTLKSYYDRVNMLLRQEVDDQTNEILTLKTKITSLEEAKASNSKKKNVGFSEDLLQVNYIKDEDNKKGEQGTSSTTTTENKKASSMEGSGKKVVEEAKHDRKESSVVDKDNTHHVDNNKEQTIEEVKAASPRGPPVEVIQVPSTAAVVPQISPRAVAATLAANNNNENKSELFTPRTAAHYEAARMSLGYIKEGIHHMNERQDEINNELPEPQQEREQPPFLPSLHGSEKDNIDMEAAEQSSQQELQEDGEASIASLSITQEDQSEFMDYTGPKEDDNMLESQPMLEESKPKIPLDYDADEYKQIEANRVAALEAEKKEKEAAELKAKQDAEKKKAQDDEAAAAAAAAAAKKQAEDEANKINGDAAPTPKKPLAMATTAFQYIGAIKIQNLVRKFIAKKRVERVRLETLAQANKINGDAAPTSSSPTPKKPLAMATTAFQYIGAIKIQNLVRKFIAKKRVERVRLETLAQANKINGDAAPTSSSPTPKKPLAMATTAFQYIGAIKIQNLVRKFIAKKRVERVRLETLAQANKINGDAAPTSSSPTPKKPLAMATTAFQYIGAIKIQNLVRKFIAKKRVERVRLETLAQANGVLVACEGTKQGETGWYKSQDQLYYFVRDEKADEFMLLCGPLSKELYSIAADEVIDLALNASISSLEHSSIDSFSVPKESTALSAKNDTNPQLPVNAKKATLLKKLPRSLHIDRLALQATRIQVETLLDDIRMRDEHVAQIEQELANLKVTVYAAQLDTIDKLKRQLEEYKQSLDVSERENEKMQYQLQHGGLSAFQKRMMEKLLSIPPELHGNFVKLTACARGFLGRKRVQRIRKIKLAQETGVLVAIGKTRQGESGWYVGPEGSIFYFVLKNGKWIYTAGPLTEADFRITDKDSKAFSRKAPQGKILVRCGFSLAGQHGTIINGGDLFIANGSGKLMLSLPIDDVIADLSEQQALDDLQTNGLTGASLSFNSSIASKLDDSVDSLEGGGSLLLQK